MNDKTPSIDLFEWINKQIITKLDNRPGASIRFEYLPLKKVMLKNNENVTVNVSKAFEEMMRLQRFYKTLSHICFIREMVKSADILQIQSRKTSFICIL